MLTLNDGRSELWQWDTGRTLAVDADCSQVHFSNKVFGRSIDVDVVGGVAIIPDILLQTDKDLNVWAFVGTAENGYTKISKTFTVNRRNKPADYVFTPKDQMTLQTIQRQIGDLADLTTTARDNLVAAINEAAKSGGGGSGTAADVRMQVAGGYIQYSTDGGTTWRNLIAMEDLIGKTAYDYAVEAGYTGTEAEFAERMAAEIPAVDSTLTKAGQAADAKATGDAVSALSKEIVTTAESKVSAHNTGTDTHSDIRVLIQGLTDRLNALADSDDTTLDQLSEVVAYIKSNRDLISSITTNKVSVADIVDNLTTNVTNKPLSAAQGVALKALIDAISVPDKLPNPNALTFTGAVTGSYDGSAAVTLEIPSGGGGSGDIIDVLMDVTIEEAVAAVTVTLDTPRAYKELYIATCVYGYESNSSANAMFLRVNNTATQGTTNAIAWIPQVENATSATAKSYGVAFVKLLHDCSFYYCYGSKAANVRTPNLSYGEMNTSANRETVISTLKFQSVNQWTKFGVGSTIKVYGVRS